MKLSIISGRSGSGKSVCLHFLEDLGFYCVDNLPVGLLPRLLEDQYPNYPGIAVSIDARNFPQQLLHFNELVKQLKTSATRVEIIFFDAQDDILLKRFSETRRKHPLSSRNISLKEALKLEQQLLEPIAQMADLRIDSSHLSIQQLRELMRNRFTHQTEGLSILFESFGYKLGIPTDADYVFDLRCLPNPYWEPQLRELTGKDAAVIEFLTKQSTTLRLFDDIRNFLEKWLPQFTIDNRSYLTIALGCTGGQHRSVYFAEALAESFRPQYPNIQVRHREL